MSTAGDKTAIKSKSDRKREPKSGTGRPTKITQALQDSIIGAVRAGNYIETAAAMNGVNKTTLYDWMKRGARAERGESKHKNDENYISFSNAIQKAMAEGEALALAQIINAANQGQWQAAAWRLERRFPDRWGRYGRVDVKVSGSITSLDLTDEEQVEYEAAVAAFFGHGRE